MLTYDFVKYCENLPHNAKDDLHLPEAHFFMIDRLVAFDHLKRKSWIILCPGVRNTALGYSEIGVDKNQCIKEAQEVSTERQGLEGKPFLMREGSRPGALTTRNRDRA